MWWIVLLIAVLAFLAVLLIRAAAFRPVAEAPEEPEAAPVDAARAVESLQAFIRCKTVSYRQEGMADAAEFEKFRALLVERYPNIHNTCERSLVGDSGILYRWKGKNSDAPAVLMAHYDVVPAAETAWQKPPFAAIIENGVLWGRGTLDTKCTLLGVVEASEQLIGEGFTPENDVYFAFSGDEEISGDSAPAIVEEFIRRGVTPAIVVDEGGAVVENVFPGVKQPCALVGTGEKGMMAATMTIEGQGGHASAPPPHTPVGILAQAVVKIENKPFPAKLSAPAADMYNTLGRHSTFVYRLIFANLWCFKPVLDALCKKQGGEMNALMRTTCAFTMMQGSNASNVLPPKAMVGANLRLAPGDTMESVEARLKQIVNDERIVFDKEYGMNPSPCSLTGNDPAWQKLKHAIRHTWPEALVSPYLMVACSDSRHYGKISKNVYRFSAMALTKEERAMIHGNDERIKLENIEKTVQFYVRLIKQL
ncbi:MAG: M20 family peptidase [Eubacteriales bacterium]|nr:M20 family peptidase [Eubacteriales bacterium]